MKIMLSAGETSGDLYGAALARELRALDPSIALIGFGGAEMAAAGVALRQNYTDYNVMGISAVLLNLGDPRFFLYSAFCMGVAQRACKVLRGARR